MAKTQPKSKAVADDKSALGISINSLKKMNVERKFTFSFMRLLYVIILISVTAFIVIGLEFFGMRTIYKSDYQVLEYIGDLRHGVTNVNVLLLEAVMADSSVQAQLMEDVSVKGEVINESLAKIAETYSDEAAVAKVQALSDRVTQVGTPMLGMVLEGTPQDELVSYYYDVFDPAMEEFNAGVEDLAEQAKAGTARMYRLAVTVTIILIIVAVLMVAGLFSFLVQFATILAASIIKPLREINHAADEMAKGNLAIDLNYTADDEFGELSDSMRNMSSVIHEIIMDLQHLMDNLGKGDLMTRSKKPEVYVGDFAPVAESIRGLRGNLRTTMTEIRDSSAQVSSGASNMSRGAQDLAEGATDQSASVEELTASITAVVEHTESLAEASEKGNRMAGDVKTEADTGIEKMGQVIEAMESITSSSNQIAGIIQTIEDIASQTNLLSLNASIEAARAGEAGKGFAVVADEIRQLAAQSGEAAGHIREVIQTTVDSVNHGNTVVEETNEALSQVAHSITEIQSIMRENAEEAANQKTAMDQISSGIEQISQVVQSNSATAEESSAISEELSAQSESLNALIAQFTFE